MEEQANKILVELLKKASNGIDAAVSFSQAQIILKANCGQENGRIKADRIGSLPKSSWALVEPCKCLVASKEAMNSLHLSEIMVSNKDSNLSSREITANHLWILTTISPLHQ